MTKQNDRYLELQTMESNRVYSVEPLKFLNPEFQDELFIFTPCIILYKASGETNKVILNQQLYVLTHIELESQFYFLCAEIALFSVCYMNSVNVLGFCRDHSLPPMTEKQMREVEKSIALRDLSKWLKL